MIRSVVVVVVIASAVVVLVVVVVCGCNYVGSGVVIVVFSLFDTYNIHNLSVSFSYSNENKNIVNFFY